MENIPVYEEMWSLCVCEDVTTFFVCILTIRTYPYLQGKNQNVLISQASSVQQSWQAWFYQCFRTTKEQANEG